MNVFKLLFFYSFLSWQGPHGFSIDYANISLHALSKDVNLYPCECLYLMIDKQVRLPGAGEPMQSNNEDDSDNESESEISELIFVPDDKSALQRMYEAIKECQELHPDPEDASTDEDEAFEDIAENGYEEEIVQNENDINSLNNMNELCISENVVQNGQNGHRTYEMDEDQFEDAD